MHDIIRIAVRWTDSHLYECETGGRCYGEPLPDEDYEDRRVCKGRRLLLETVIARGVDSFVNPYDFGEHWMHHRVVEGVREVEARAEFPALVDGARRGTCEDVAGCMVSWSSWRRRWTRSTRCARR